MIKKRAEQSSTVTNKSSDVTSASAAAPKNVEMSGVGSIPCEQCGGCDAQERQDGKGWIQPLLSMPRLRRSRKTRWQGMNSTLAMNAAAATLEKLLEH